MSLTSTADQGLKPLAFMSVSRSPSRTPVSLLEERISVEIPVLTEVSGVTNSDAPTRCQREVPSVKDVSFCRSPDLAVQDVQYQSGGLRKCILKIRRRREWHYSSKSKPYNGLHQWHCTPADGAMSGLVQKRSSALDTSDSILTVDRKFKPTTWRKPFTPPLSSPP